VEALEQKMTSELATKSDIAQLRAATKAEFALQAANHESALQALVAGSMATLAALLQWLA
jgi:hypothetical protein